MTFTMQQGGLELVDYIVFVLLCVASCAGGLWYSATASRKENIVDIRDYLLGGQKLYTFPVALSLIASYVSGVTILGTPAEIYNYGTQYWLVVFAVTFSSIIVATIYLPVFCTLRLSSSYEYLELRFNMNVRAVASIIFLLDEILFLPMVVYVPALAFNQLTGFNVYAVAGVMVLICGLYTVLGGLRAVVWTDSVQTVIMYIGVISAVIAGAVCVGGFGTIIEICKETGRLSLDNWNFSPYERQTGWGAIIGGTIYWTCFNSVNQTMVQRYISLPTKRHAVIALAIFTVGAVLAICLCVLCGLMAWVAWIQGGCHPGGVPLVGDKLLPAFVTFVAEKQGFKGLTGIFLAGVFGAGLSSLSAVLNACALVCVEDIMRGWLKLKLKPMSEGIIARLITAVLAVISVLMLAVISKLGGVLGVATALSAIAASTTCGIFTLGMAFWWVGPKGAVAGAIAGALTAGTISAGSQVASGSGYRAPPMEFSQECAKNATYAFSSLDPETVFPLFRLSYHWIAPCGLLVTLIVGAIVGRILDKKAHMKMDPELFTPIVWRWLPQEFHDHAGEIRHARDLIRHSPSSPLILSPISAIVSKDPDCKSPML